MKTPRMVKQASKKNSKVKRNGSGEEDSESLEVRIRSFYAAAFLFDPLTWASSQKMLFRLYINKSLKYLSSDQKRLMSRLTLWTRRIHHLHCLEATSPRCTTSSQTRESTFSFFYFPIHGGNIQHYLSPDRTSQKMVLAETQVEGIRVKAKGMSTI